MEVTMVLPIAAGQFWLMAGIWTFPSCFRISFKNCPEALFPSGFLTTFFAFPSVYPTAFKTISQPLMAKMCKFPSLFTEGPRLCWHWLKVEGAIESVKKNTSFSFLRTDFSKNLTFSQSQSHATVPLRDLIKIQHVVDIESQQMSMLLL